MKEKISNNKWLLVGIISFCLLAFAPFEAFAVRIKDITDIKGVRHNQLVGYGLVVGLEGTGDGNKTQFTVNSLTHMLRKMGMTVTDPEDVKVENVAAVMVTAELPPFSRVGSKIDVLVSSIGDAENLQGGTLIFTPLRSASGDIFAVAQGPLSTGGFSAEGAGGKVQKNFPTVGRVVEGAIVEKEMVVNLNSRENITLALGTPDFTTASRVAEAINKVFLTSNPAKTVDAGSIEVAIPDQYMNKIVAFVTKIEGLDVVPDSISKVIINERTGTVVMGENVRISTVAIAHGNLSLQITEGANVSQPLPFSSGETVVVPETNIEVNEEKPPIYLVESGVSIAEIVKALNAMGVSPRDLIAIFQALKSAGALQAQLEII